MKNKILESFDEAVADVFDGAILAASGFGTGTSSQAFNLWEAIYKKNVKNLTIVYGMVRPIVDRGPLSGYGPTNCILQPGKVKRIITSFTAGGQIRPEASPNTAAFAAALKDIEVIPTTFGNWCTKLEAAACGYGGILTPVGIGTFLEELCAKFVIDGKEFLLEKPLVPDFGFVKAWKADRLGNLVYRRGQRVQGPLVARASKVTIAEVLEIVEPGQIDPDQVHTPHIYVDRIVRVPRGGMGSFEWDEVMKVQSFSPGGSRRQMMESRSG